jgi:hypothetical protein
MATIGGIEADAADIGYIRSAPDLKIAAVGAAALKREKPV